jgi:Cu(I)/Ag(I) efflux system protein CusF
MIKYFATMLGAMLLALPAVGTQHNRPSLTEGEVRKIDKEAKKITIKHEPIHNLDMPAMTMVFQVKDLTMLEMVKAGDKIRFEAQKLGGAFTVTQIEKQNQ